MAQQKASLEEELGIDATALRARYRLERDKRLDPRGIGQFAPTRGRFEHYRHDPYVEPGSTRAPLTDEVDVAVIGCGFGGLLLGAHLRQAGVQNIRFIDRAGDFGGVWYWNRYPGAACDTESYVYLPMLEELGYMPSRKYARAPEILAHCKRIAQRFDLYRDACFQTEVTALQWDEARARWTISTDRRDAIHARYVAISPGPLDRPKLPGIPGIEGFKGHSFHTSRWDYGYTGGDALGGLSKLSDKVVGIIGTGATAVQCVPYLAESAKHLYVFQRTPSPVDVREDRLTDPAWFRGQEPGWQRRRMENFTRLVSGGDADVDLVNDGWTAIHRNVRYLMERKKKLSEAVTDPAELIRLANFMKMEELRRRVAHVVRRESTAESLKPWYDFFCKRPCFHDLYLQAFNRENVTLVDTGGKGVDRISQNSVVFGNRDYAIDCLIYGTGFEVGEYLSHRIGIDISGRNGQRLTERWAKGPMTLHGLMTCGFPNLLFLSHVQAGLSLNFPHTIDEQGRHAAYIIGRALAEGMVRLEPTEQAESDWVAEVERAAIADEEFHRECTPSYLNFEGDRKRANVRNLPYGGGPMRFFEILAQWRADGSMAGLERVSS